jgi:glutathione S-transferase
MMLKIFDFLRGARGLRSAWLCEEMGVRYEFTPVTFPPQPEYVAINPSGRVPYLRDGDVGMGESIAMMLYVAERFGPTDLLPREPALLARVLELTIFGEASLAAHMDVLLAVKFGGAPGGSGGWSEGVARSQLQRSMQHVMTALAAGPMICGDRFTMADISIATALYILRGALQQDLPAPLIVYLDLVQSRAAYLNAWRRWS